MEFDYIVKHNPRLVDLPTLLTKWRATEMQSMTNDLDKTFRKQRRQTFRSEGAVSVGKWRRLSNAYGKWKAKAAPNKKILELTGQMKRTLTEKFNPSHIARYSMRPYPTVTLGTRDDKAVKHFTGEGKLPVRDPVTSSEHQKRALFKIVAKHMARKAERALRVIRAAMLRGSRGNR